MKTEFKREYIKPEIQVVKLTLISDVMYISTNAEDPILNNGELDIDIGSIDAG